MGNKYFDNGKYGAVRELNFREIISVTEYERLGNEYDDMIHGWGVWDKFIKEIERVSQADNEKEDHGCYIWIKNASDKRKSDRKSNLAKVSKLIIGGSIKESYKNGFLKMPNLKPLVVDLLKNDPLDYPELSQTVGSPLAVLQWFDVEATLPLVYSRLEKSNTTVGKAYTKSVNHVKNSYDRPALDKEKHEALSKIKGVSQIAIIQELIDEK